MPITKSAKKAIRVSARKKSYNDSRKRAMKDAMKKFERVAKTDKKEAEKFLASLYQRIDKSAKTNIITRNRADRMKSRLTKKLK